MLRFIVKILLLLAVLGVAAIMTAQWKLNNELDDFAKKIGPFVDFRYESAKMGLTGEVEINEISLFLEPVSTTIEIGKVRFLAGTLLDMVFLGAKARKNEFPESGHLELVDVLIPFNDTLLRAINDDSPTTSFEILQAANCGNLEKLRIPELIEMGYGYVSLSSKNYYSLDKYSGSVVMNGSFDVEEMSYMDYQVNIGGVLSWIEYLKGFQTGQFSSSSNLPHVSLLDFRLQDRGYNQKLATYCAKKKNIEVEAYFSGHMDEIERMLKSGGMVISDEAKSAYLEGMQPESKVHWLIQPKATFDFEGVSYYTYDELIEQSGFSVSINDKPVESILDSWSGEAFNKIAARELVRRAKDDPESTHYKNLKQTKKFQSVRLSSVGDYLNYKVRIVRNDKRKFVGKLSRVSKKQVWLTMYAGGGNAVIPLYRSRMRKLEVFKPIPR